MPNPTERAIFLQAVEEENLDDRQAYLDSACGDDRELRASIEALLAAHDEPAALLDHPIGADDSHPTLLISVPGESIDQISSQIGPYKLKEQIGEGGFGLVFVAEQEQPVRRKVALKIVKPGLGSKAIIARFEAERQAVAMMNHPNIAQVFDAGVTEDGRPYFVMELVRGLPITEFCDKKRLNITQRLELMIDVCSAVHHAHQKGIIHRDLKPSNVLVTLHDGRPVVKVIDFGVAKALGGKLTDKSIYTSFLSMIGTPLYMSPEQAEMSSLDVDTRSDIFSLGVVLYELLAGETPFDRKRLDSAGLDELRRIIREEEPPRPSTRLSTCNEAATTIADRRHIDPRGLASAIAGDLDWIVMKSLEKDRSRRYDSAAALADDLKRYLENQPIQARPPSTLYRVRKYARRHRVAFLTATLVSISLILGTAGSLWQMSKAIGERNAKDTALREATQAKTDAIAAKQKVERFAADLVRANELVVSGQSHADAGRWQDAMRDYEAAVEIQPSYYLPRVQRAQLFTRLGLWPEAAQDYAKAINMGASTSQPQWWGVPALFLYTGYDEPCERILERRREEILRNPSTPGWMLLRDIAVSNRPISSGELEPFIELTRQWLREREFDHRPKPPPMDLDFGPPADRMRGGPEHGPRRDHLGQPVLSDSTPLAVRHYIAAMVLLRAGEFDQALDLLAKAEQDRRWPGQYLVHAPAALAHYWNGDTALASEALEHSDAGIREWLSASEEGSLQSTQAPWFDLVEGLLIHREAWQVIRGTTSPLAAQLDKRRAAAKKLLNGVSSQ
ncbi:serine/threonine-protein kinase [Rubinisphaera margarita]|uniref:serine/threonine-protein kinase n=1 Tax=Rubinisphaera margarita TaxID=2909586 RepID=UPI001EE80597|nr:serine/threonine-protein kinase [Rubinisphaera margarita]MCG6158013.1 serine/threonine protein kinase [Rubinisphaera margarita]